MKKFLVAIVAVLFAAPSFAQFNSGGFSLNESTVYYGMRLGLNVSNLTGDMAENGSKAGLNFAGVLGLRISDSTPIFLESGLYFTQRGAKKNKNTYANLNYLEIPVLLKYGIQATDEIAVLPFIGPTFSYGIGGKEKLGDGASKDDSFSNDIADFKRLDAGIKIGCGAEYNKLYLEMGYQFGLSNIADWKVNATDDASVHNGAFFVNLGVNF
jgi:hypothetical protein